MVELGEQPLDAARAAEHLLDQDERAVDRVPLDVADDADDAGPMLDRRELEGQDDWVRLASTEG